MIHVRYVDYRLFCMAYYFEVVGSVAYIVYAHGFTKKRARKRLLKRVGVNG